MAATLTSVDAALKETWTEDKLAEQLYQDNPLLNRIKKLKTTQVGQQAVTPVHTGRNWAYSPLPAGGGNLQTAGQQELTQATWQYTHHNMPIAIQGSAIDGTRGDALSVAQVVDLEVTGALNDLQRQLSRQLFLDGSGTITTAGVTSASGTVVLNTADGFNAIERGWIAVGEPINLGTTSNPSSLLSAVPITAVSESATAPTFTTATSVTTTSANIVSMPGARSGSTSYEMNGLVNTVGSSTFGGINPATYPVWQSYVDSTAQALTLPLMYGANRKVMQKTGKPSTYIVTSLKQQQAFYQLVQAQVRFAGDSGLGAGNVDGVQFNGMTVYAQPDCKNEQMFFLTVDDLLLVSAGDPSWINKIEGGGNVLRWIQGTDSYGSKITVRLNLGASRRNSHAALTGLT